MSQFKILLRLFMQRFDGLLFITLCFLITACSTKTNKEDPPLWYFEHTQDRAYIYGYGSARNEEGAKAEALRDLQAQLRLKVQSQMQISKQQHNDVLFQMPDSMFIMVPEIDPSHIRLSKKMQYEGVYYVRLEILKDHLLKEFQKEYQKHLKALEGIAQIPCELHSRDLMLLRSHLKEVGRLGAVMEAFGIQRANTQPYYTLLQKNPAKPRLHLRITINDERYEELSQKTLKKEISRIYTIDSKSQNTIYVDLKTEKSKFGTIMGADVVLRDCQNRMVFETKITTANGSKGPYEGMRLNINKVAQELTEKLKVWSMEEK